jgi:ribosomal protein L7/L12
MRYMVFAVDPTKDSGEAMGGFQFDHDDFDYVQTFIDAAVPNTPFSKFEVLDTETFDVHTWVIDKHEDEKYRVVLVSVPTDRKAEVLMYLAGILEVPAREIPLYVQTMPSFVGQHMQLQESTTIKMCLEQLGAVARVERE